MLPVLVEPLDGRYQASVPGAPGLRAEGATRDEAVAALRADLDARYARGELVWVDPPTITNPPPPRRFTQEEIEATREMVAEMYRARDAQKVAEFPE